MSYIINEAIGNFSDTVHTAETEEEAQEWLNDRRGGEVLEEIGLIDDLDELEEEFNTLYEDFASYYSIEEV